MVPFIALKKCSSVRPLKEKCLGRGGGRGVFHGFLEGDTARFLTNTLEVFSGYGFIFAILKTTGT